MTTPVSSNSGTATSGRPDFELVTVSVSTDSTMPKAASPTVSPSPCSSSCDASDPSSSPLPAKLSPVDDTQLEILLTSDGKQCYSCRRSLPLEAFSRAVVKGVEYRNPRCNTCRAYRQKTSSQGQVRRRLLAEAKAQPCVDCGGRFGPECMDFDHVRGAKEFNVSSAFLWMRLDRLYGELAKCDLVCANCHRTRSVKRGSSRGRPTRYLADLPHEPEHVDPVRQTRKPKS